MSKQYTIIKAKKAVVINDEGQPKAQILNNVGLKIADGKIVDILNTIPSDLQDCVAVEADLITPGFVDIHNHGVGGSTELVQAWLFPEFTCSKLVEYGTTSIIASLTFPKDDLTNTKIINNLKNRIGVPIEGQAVLDGIHAEGPIVPDLGGLPPGSHDMPLDKFQEFVNQFENSLKIMTISPHLEAKNNYQRIKYLLEKNITVSLGHDKKANEEEILGALKLSQTPMHMTHIFNVQSFHHRDIGLANIGLLSKFPNIEKYKGIVEPTIEFISDLQHLHPFVIQLILSSKRADKAVCVTDAVLEPGTTEQHTYAGRDLEVVRSDAEEPKVVLKGTSTIAGSCTTMLASFHKLVNYFHVKIEDAVVMLSWTPAQVAKLAGVGNLKQGYRADILCFDENLQLQKTLVAGKIVYTK